MNYKSRIKPIIPVLFFILFLELSFYFLAPNKMPYQDSLAWRSEYNDSELYLRINISSYNSICGFYPDTIQWGTKENRFGLLVSIEEIKKADDLGAIDGSVYLESLKNERCASKTYTDFAPNEKIYPEDGKSIIEYSYKKNTDGFVLDVKQTINGKAVNSATCDQKRCFELKTN